MIFFELAKRNLRLHLFRSILAVLGVIIGVTSITAMGILGAGIVLFISEDLTKVSDTLVVTPHVGGAMGFSTANDRITDRQFEQIKRAAAPSLAVPVYQTSDRMSVGSEETAGIIYGLDPKDMPVFLDIKEGSMLRGSSGAMVGARFAEDNKLKVGSLIGVRDKGTLRVSAILKERGMGFDINPDYGIVVSSKWFQDSYNRKEYDSVIVKVKSLDEIDSTKKAIEKALNRGRETVVDVVDTRKIMETILDSFSRISLFTTAIGGISLVVAGVSILNVMLMSVTERTREIGIMRSIGAKRKEVRRMFLYEALLLGLIGSGIGAVLSVFAGLLVSQVMLQTTRFVFAPSSMIYILYGMAFGVGTCLLSGFYPAWKASDLNPIEALRHE